MGMDVIITGGTPQGAAVGQDGADLICSPTFGAAHVAAKPDEYQFSGRILGHYSQAFTVAGQVWSGTPTILLAWRWIDASSLCVVKRVRATGVVTTAGTGSILLDAIAARGYSLEDTTASAAAPAPVNDSGKLRQSMGPTLMGSGGGTVRLANAAAGASGGTKTLDANPLASVGLGIGPLAADVGRASTPVELVSQFSVGHHPLVLRQNEGFLVRQVSALTTTVLQVNVTVDWLEAVAY